MVTPLANTSHVETIAREDMRGWVQLMSEVFGNGNAKHILDNTRSELVPPIRCRDIADTASGAWLGAKLLRIKADRALVPPALQVRVADELQSIIGRAKRIVISARGYEAILDLPVSDLVTLNITVTRAVEQAEAAGVQMGPQVWEAIREECAGLLLPGSVESIPRLQEHLQLAVGLISTNENKVGAILELLGAVELRSSQPSNRGQGLVQGNAGEQGVDLFGAPPMGRPVPPPRMGGETFVPAAGNITRYSRGSVGDGGTQGEEGQQPGDAETNRSAAQALLNDIRSEWGRGLADASQATGSGPPTVGGAPTAAGVTPAAGQPTDWQAKLHDTYQAARGQEDLLAKQVLAVWVKLESWMAHATLAQKVQAGKLICSLRDGDAARMQQKLLLLRRAEVSLPEALVHAQQSTTITTPMQLLLMGVSPYTPGTAAIVQWLGKLETKPKDKDKEVDKPPTLVAGLDSRGLLILAELDAKLHYTRACRETFEGANLGDDSSLLLNRKGLSKVLDGLGREVPAFKTFQEHFISELSKQMVGNETTAKGKRYYHWVMNQVAVQLTKIEQEEDVPKYLLMDVSMKFGWEKFSIGDKPLADLLARASAKEGGDAPWTPRPPKKGGDGTGAGGGKRGWEPQAPTKSTTRVERHWDSCWNCGEKGHTLDYCTCEVNPALTSSERTRVGQALRTQKQEVTKVKKKKKKDA
jgi:hypothetical protein